MSSFADLGIEARLCDALLHAGIATPFPIQEITLKDALAGRDVCGKAPTGSGKTLAYGLAVIQQVEKARPRRPRALVLVPTRELAGQVATALAPYGQARQRWVTAFFGGAGMMRQISDLKRGVDVAVATPGRITDLVMRNECDLSDVDLVVIDEADRMADMGFTPQVSWLLDRVSENRQILLFSATLDGDVDNLIKTYLKDPVQHEMASPTGEDEDTSVLQRARHFTTPSRNDTKFQDVSYIVDASEKAIVFVKNRFATERMADALESLGVTALAMHGGMTQAARSKSLQRWADGKVKALIATDVAARGVHVDGVELVVHVDVPQDQKDYLHRSGRTARAGASGVVVSLMRKEQRKQMAAMFGRLGVEVEEVTGADIREVLGEVRVISADARALLSPARATALGDWIGEEDDEFVQLTDRNGKPSRDNRSNGPGGYQGGSSDSRGRDSRGSENRGGGGSRGGYGDRPSSGSRPWEKNSAGFGGRPTGDRAPAWAKDGARASFERGSSGRPSFGDRPDRSGSGRPSFGDRPDRGDRPAFADRGARPSYAERTSSSDRPSQGAYGDRPKFADRGARSAFGDRPAQTERARNDRPAYGDRPSFSDRPSFGDRPDRSDGDRDTTSASKSFSKPAWGSDRGAREDRPARENRFVSEVRPAWQPAKAPGERPATRVYGEEPGRSSYRDRTDERSSEGASKPWQSGVGRSDRPAFAGSGARSEGRSDSRIEGRNEPWRPSNYAGPSTGGFDRSGGDRPRTGGFNRTAGSSDRPGFSRGPSADRGARPGGSGGFDRDRGAKTGSGGFAGRSGGASSTAPGNTYARTDRRPNGGAGAARWDAANSNNSGASGSGERSWGAKPTGGREAGSSAWVPRSTAPASRGDRWAGRDRDRPATADRTTSSKPAWGARRPS